MSERGVLVDHTTLYRWVQRYAPLMEKRIRWYQRYTDASWRVDETYVKVAGQWAYLYRAIDKLMPHNKITSVGKRRPLKLDMADIPERRASHRRRPTNATEPLSLPKRIDRH